MSESKAERENEDHSLTPDDSRVLQDAPDDSGALVGSGTDSTVTGVERSDTPRADLKNRQLGEFRLLRRLGQGGMAEVYLAEQVSLKRKVAVKVLREEMVGDEVHLQRFEQEAKAAGGLNHVNIVQVFMIGEHEGVHYIAQEYVAGMNLREYLNRNGPPKLRIALKLLEQIASALEAAAEAGIVHRDVKPENILVTRKGDVKVTDFGLAQLSLTEERLNLTQVGMTMGTPLYMSPEQVDGRDVDHRSDIYSLGVTSYHLLGGSPPFRGETALSVAVQHVNADPPPLQDQRPDLPNVVCRLVHKMMAKAPDDRYQTASALADDLRKISAALKDNPASLERIRLADSDAIPAGWNWFSRVAHWTLKRKIVVTTVLFLAVSGASAAVGFFTRPPDPFLTPTIEKEKTIPRKTSAFLQWHYAAQLVNDEEAWKAVGKYYPEPKDQQSERLARLGLAMLYLHSSRLEEAEQIFKKFTLEDPKDESLKARGYAGLAVIAGLREEYAKSQRIILDDFSKYREKLSDPKLRRFVEDAYRHNSTKLGESGPKDLFPTEEPKSKTSKPTPGG